MVTDESDGEYSEEIILSMKLAAERYSAPCPFKVGQFIKPREDSCWPYDDDSFFIVLEVFEIPFRQISDSEFNSLNYSKNDMRIGKYGSGKIYPSIAESWNFQEYEP